MKRLIALAAFGLGYVLGAQAGRERYEQLKRGFRRVREDPRVQEQAHHVADVAKERAPEVVDKVSSAASSAVHKVRGSTDAPDPGAAQDPDVIIDPDGPPIFSEDGAAGPGLSIPRGF